ncbi:tyrosine-type recombinase/integrase [Methylobacterium variabile]|jgi:integrase|uniref:tyrosine-type recombinase/integrase n=1 Tax=Methylobacterium variabile TaxID=298794 RepID=UPI0009F8B21C|nr:tyrosine-type recombinase/integrase [Methylobacterium variabile]
MLTSATKPWPPDPRQAASEKPGAVQVGLSGVSPHILRHSAAVWMAEAGAPISEIAAYLGHGDAASATKRYARFTPTHLRRAFQALAVGRLRVHANL